MPDPTRIDLQTDPQTKRMSGRAIHGNIPFDVPYVSEIRPGLWQGGCANGLVLPPNIKHLVSLYPWESYTGERELDTALFVRMFDATDQDMKMVDSLALWVLDCWADGPTLVHCQAGLNRSSLVVARALMFNGRSADSAIRCLREKRSPACLCNPAFEAWLREQD